jgi:hypothetical protein
MQRHDRESIGMTSLINRFKKYEECENIRPGGEGKLKWGPPYYAYLAMKTK